MVENIRMVRGISFAAVATHRIRLPKMLIAAAGTLVMLAAQAHATTVTTLTFGGTVNSIYDGSGLFGNSGVSYNSGAFTGTISFTPPTALCNPNNCTYSLGAANAIGETLTFNGHTATFNATSADLRLNPYNPQQITFSNLGGTGFNFSSEQFQDATSFFGASSPNLSAALSFGTVSISGTGSGQEGNTTIGLKFTSVSAATATTPPPTATPEPASLALLGMGMVCCGLLSRRGQTI